MFRRNLLAFLCALSMLPVSASFAKSPTIDVNFQRFPTLDAKKLVNAPKMSAHHRGICHF